MNFFVVSGRIGSDPQSKSVGMNKVLNFSLAFDVGRANNKQTTWLSCTLWNAPAENLAPYLSKGLQVTVGGSISLRKYTGNDGKEGVSLDMNVSQLTLPPKPKDASSPPSQSSEAPF